MPVGTVTIDHFDKWQRIWCSFVFMLIRPTGLTYPLRNITENNAVQAVHVKKNHSSFSCTQVSTTNNNWCFEDSLYKLQYNIY